MNCIAATALFSIVSSLACAAPESQIADAVTRSSLKQWGWEGEWSNDCSGSGGMTVRYHHTIPTDGGHPFVSVARNGKFVLEEVVTSASVSRANPNALELRVHQESSAGITDIYRLIVKSGSMARVMQSDGVAVYNIDMPASEAFPHALKAGKKEHQTYVVNGNITGPPGSLRGPTHPIFQCSQ